MRKWMWNRLVSACITVVGLALVGREAVRSGVHHAMRRAYGVKDRACGEASSLTNWIAPEEVGR